MLNKGGKCCHVTQSFTLFNICLIVINDVLFLRGLPVIASKCDFFSCGGVNRMRQAAKRVVASAVVTDCWVIEPEPTEKSGTLSLETENFRVLLSLELAFGIHDLKP